MTSVVMRFHSHQPRPVSGQTALEQPIGGLVTSWELSYSPVLGRRIRRLTAITRLLWRWR
jgi:hypothetical protein